MVFAIGVWTLVDRSFMERLLGSNLYVTSASLLIAAGIIVAFISFLGSLGAYKGIYDCIKIIYLLTLCICRDSLHATHFLRTFIFDFYFNASRWYSWLCVPKSGVQFFILPFN